MDGEKFHHTYLKGLKGLIVLGNVNGFVIPILTEYSLMHRYHEQ